MSRSVEAEPFNGWSNLAAQHTRSEMKKLPGLERHSHAGPVEAERPQRSGEEALLLDP